MSKAALKDAKADVTADAIADAVTSAAHVRTEQSKPEQLKARRPNWGLPRLSLPAKCKTLQILHLPLKAATTTANPAKSARVTVTAVIADRVQSALTSPARIQKQRHKPVLHNSQLQSARRLSLHL